MDETEYCNKTISYIGKERAYLTAELEKLGIKVYRGSRFPAHKDRRSLIRKVIKEKDSDPGNCSNYRGLSKGYYRIAVKTHEENEKLIAQLKDTI